MTIAGSRRQPDRAQQAGFEIGTDGKLGIDQQQ